MTNYRWRVSLETKENCGSCAGCDGQIHPYEVWHAAGLWPQSPELFCAHNCKCTLEPTEDAETGSLANIPTRAPHPAMLAAQASEQTLPPVANAMKGNHPMTQSPNLQMRVQLKATPTANGKFEIAAITAGDGNGWTFTDLALKNSVPLWEGAHIFVNHEGWSVSRDPIRDLGGVLKAVRFDDSLSGIVGTLQTIGPSGPLVEALGRELLASDAPPADVGFSADLIFTAVNNTVETVLRVLSVDLVFDPARGGAFIRALNSVQGAEQMPIETPQTVESETKAPAPTNPLKAQFEKDMQAARALLQVNKEQEDLKQAAAEAQKTRVQMCEVLLDTVLGGSTLPEKTKARVRKQFAGKAFELADLQSTITEAREEIAALTASQIVDGPRRVSAMFSGEEQIQLAVDDMFLVSRDDKLKGAKIARLSGIRELYHLLTGDFEMRGEYDPMRAMFQHTTTTFAGLVKNAMNKAVIERWKELGRAGYEWWKDVATVEHFDTLNQVTWIITGTASALPTIAEGAEYTELKTGDSAEVSSFTKYGGYVGITMEALDRDETRKLRNLPRELAFAGIRKLSALVAAIFTDNSAAGPTLADTGALFNSTAVTTAGGHANLLTTALGTDYVAWDAAAKAVYDQPMLIANETSYYGTGAKQALEPTICLVPRALKAQAEALFIPRWASSVEAVATKGGPSYGAFVKPITVPEWTDGTDWAACIDPALAPAVMIGERFGIMPEIYVAGDQLSPAVFTNDESRIKVRHFLAVGVCDYRPLHKSNVA